MTSRSELRRIAIQRGEPMPEFGIPDRTGEMDHPSVSPVPESAPGINTPLPVRTPLLPGPPVLDDAAEGGQCGPPFLAPARAPAAVAAAGQGTPARSAMREGTAGPGGPPPGPAQTPEGEECPRAAASPSGSTGRTWTVELPAGLDVVSLNDRDHYMRRHRRMQVLKDAAIVMVRQAKVPQLDRITLTVIYDPPDRRHRDADNLAPTGKALLDGLAFVILPSYGGGQRVVPGDDSRHVAGVCYAIGQRPYPRGRLRMVISELAGSAA